MQTACIVATAHDVSIAELPIALLTLSCVVAGCGSDDGGGSASTDAITPQEEAEGAAWSGSTDDDGNRDQEPVDIAESTKSCHKATGYRSGRAFTICVTKVDGKGVEVNTARAYLRMRSNARAHGVGLYVVSGFRTMAEQRYLYHCYKTRSCNGGNVAAPPGYSNHQSGHALDLNTSARGAYSYLASRGHVYGFRRTVPSEKWHWEH